MVFSHPAGVFWLQSGLCFKVFLSDPEGTLNPESSDDSYILCLWFGGSGTPSRPSLAMFSFSRVSGDTLLSFLVASVLHCHGV
jgi:hypothetical protein